MGSGAFLVAACRYLASAYEIALVAEGRCAETIWMRTNTPGFGGRWPCCCLSGVDANPTAVQLARLSLWLTTLARDKPLSFSRRQVARRQFVAWRLAGRSPGASRCRGTTAGVTPPRHCLTQRPRRCDPDNRENRCGNYARARRHGCRCSREGAHLVRPDGTPVADRTMAKWPVTCGVHAGSGPRLTVSVRHRPQSSTR
jgi:hypothetical protein